MIRLAKMERFHLLHFEKSESHWNLPLFIIQIAQICTMSQNLQCSQCENRVEPTWKYCRYCGNKLDINRPQESPQAGIADREEIERKIDVEVKHVEPFDKKLYYKVLSTRAERSVILKRKNKIRQEIDSLLEQLQAGLIGKDTVLPKVKELKEEVQSINQQAKSFSNIPEELPIEVLNDEIEAAKQRLRKIEYLKSDENLGKDTIREAKQRTQDSINLLREQQSEIFGHLRSWRADLEQNIETVRKDIEYLYVRFKTDEITESSYQEKKEKLVASIENDQEVVEILQRILA